MLQDLLLDLEAHLVLEGDALLQDLDGHLPAEVGLRLQPDLLAQVGLGEAARTELDGMPLGIQHEGITARAGDARLGVKGRAPEVAFPHLGVRQGHQSGDGRPVIRHTHTVR